LKSVVVIQARTSSSRLPAKVLLPIKGVPLVVLAARRASNTGKKVLVVTSRESSDDGLCAELNRNGIGFYRGSLDNTLERFVRALDGYEDKAVVLRLTADNVIPDGGLLDEVEDCFRSNDLDYLVCNGERSGLPYGVSIEVMRLSSLRDANERSVDMSDLEHVTPFIRRRFGERYFDKYRGLKMGAYRSTVDSIDDYYDIHELFEKFECPEEVSWLELVQELKVQSKYVLVTSPVKKMVLGGAQIGLNYGINNSHGKPSFKSASNLVIKAICNGVEYIDTASAYGDSESILGKILTKGWASRVTTITKLTPLNDCHEGMDEELVSTFVKASVYQSCFHLGVQTLSCLMLHRASHLTNWGGIVWKTLLELQEQGVVSALGVSVQTPDEVELVLANKAVGFIQMPFNLLDDRWVEAIKSIQHRKKERKIVVHVRSSLLQGLLISEDHKLWERANVEKPSLVIEYLKRLAEETKCNSILELCLTYVRSLNWVDGVVVGMETVQQLEENLDLFSKKEFSPRAMELFQKEAVSLSEMTLDPSNWSQSD